MQYCEIIDSRINTQGASLRGIASSYGLIHKCEADVTRSDGQGSCPAADWLLHRQGLLTGAELSSTEDVELQRSHVHVRWSDRSKGRCNTCCGRLSAVDSIHEYKSTVGVFTAARWWMHQFTINHSAAVCPHGGLCHSVVTLVWMCLYNNGALSQRNLMLRLLRGKHGLKALCVFIYLGVKNYMSWLTLSSGHIFDSRPPVEDHGAVVVDVEERNLIVLLPQDEEELLTHRGAEEAVGVTTLISHYSTECEYESTWYSPCHWARWPWRRRTTSRLWPSGRRAQWRRLGFTYCY